METKNPDYKEGVEEVKGTGLIATHPDPKSEPKSEPEPIQNDKRYGIRMKTVIAGLNYLLEKVEALPSQKKLTTLKRSLKESLKIAKKL